MTRISKFTELNLLIHEIVDFASSYNSNIGGSKFMLKPATAATGWSLSAGKNLCPTGARPVVMAAGAAVLCLWAMTP